MLRTNPLTSASGRKALHLPLEVLHMTQEKTWRNTMIHVCLHSGCQDHAHCQLNFEVMNCSMLMSKEIMLDMWMMKRKFGNQEKFLMIWTNTSSLFWRNLKWLWICDSSTWPLWLFMKKGRIVLVFGNAETFLDYFWNTDTSSHSFTGPQAHCEGPQWKS